VAPLSGSGLDKSLCLLGEVSPARGKTARLIDVNGHVLPCSLWPLAVQTEVIRDKLFRDEDNSRGEFKMRELFKLVVASIIVTMMPVVPAIAQQPSQQPPMMGQGQGGGTMGQGQGGGTMGQGQGQSGGMMGQGQGGGMMGQGQGGGMMGQGQGGGMMGQGGMMGGGMMGHGQGQGGMMGSCPKMGGMKMGGMMGKGMMHSRPMMEARLAYIKADLEITEAQTAAWNAYADAVRAHYGAMATAREAMSKAMQSGKTLERMDARIQATQAKLDSLKALKPATEELFKVLTDEQKKKADQLLGAACRMM